MRVRRGIRFFNQEQSRPFIIFELGLEGRKSRSTSANLLKAENCLVCPRNQKETSEAGGECPRGRKKSDRQISTHASSEFGVGYTRKYCLCTETSNLIYSFINFFLRLLQNIGIVYILCLRIQSLAFSDSHIADEQNVSCLPDCFLSSAFCMSPLPPRVLPWWGPLRLWSRLFQCRSWPGFIWLNT